MIKAEGSTPSIVSAFNPRRIFLLDAQPNSSGAVYASCTRVWAGKVAELLREGPRTGKQRQTVPREAWGNLPSPHPRRSQELAEFKATGQRALDGSPRGLKGRFPIQEPEQPLQREVPPLSHDKGPRECL